MKQPERDKEDESILKAVVWIANSEIFNSEKAILLQALAPLIQQYIARRNQLS